VSDEADRQRARGGLRQTLRGLDMLESNLQSCSDPQLAETLRKIQRRKARQSVPFLNWLRLGGESARFSSLASDASTDLPAQFLEKRPEHGAGGAMVLDRLEVTPALVRLKIQRPAGFDFKPGQSAKIGLAGLKRRYSIASAPHEDFLEFFIELVPGGDMSERLRSVSRGDRLTLDSLSGSFLLNEKFSTHLMVATVTGVAPFISMLRHAFTGPESRRDRRFILLHGASYQNEFGYRNELEGLAVAHAERFIYMPTVSRPEEPANTGWPGERGRVGTLVQPTIDTRQLEPASTCIYACGHSGMVDDVAARLGGQNFTVRREVYD
jgi:ferredoxin--NADP+ reductase